MKYFIYQSNTEDVILDSIGKMVCVDFKGCISNICGVRVNLECRKKYPSNLD